jgi:hypothetical protein
MDKNEKPCVSKSIMYWIHGMVPISEKHDTEFLHITLYALKGHNKYLENYKHEWVKPCNINYMQP